MFLSIFTLTKMLSKSIERLVKEKNVSSAESVRVVLSDLMDACAVCDDRLAKLIKEADKEHAETEKGQRPINLEKKTSILLTELIH